MFTCTFTSFPYTDNFTFEMKIYRVINGTSSFQLFIIRMCELELIYYSMVTFVVNSFIMHYILQYCTVFILLCTYFTVDLGKAWYEKISNPCMHLVKQQLMFGSTLHGNK